MSELNAFPDPPDPTQKRPSRWKKAIGAGVLSLFFPGMGQLLNRQPRKAILLAIASYLLDLLPAKTHLLLLSLHTTAAVILVVVLFKLGISAEAAHTAATAKQPESAIPNARFAYTLIAILIFLSVVLPDRRKDMHNTGFAAFRISSNSMCPTMCADERFVADTNAYKTSPPHRGDLVLLKHASSDAPMIKRVVGIPGDVVEPGPDGTVLINGRPFQPPAPCGNPSWQKHEPAQCPMCGTKKVSEGTLFVIGDNVEKSFDSRYTEFGTVTPDMVRGRPLYLYWSSTLSRFGCPVH